MSARIRLVLADVDGTLVTPDKTLTGGAIRAVERLGDAGIIFALTSARPPQGLSMFVGPLALTTPLAALNGGLVVGTDMTVIEEKTIPDHLVAPILELLGAHGLSPWVYQGAHWLVLDEDDPHVTRESRTCECVPTLRRDFSDLGPGVTKIVGVSDDATACAAANAAVSGQFASMVSVTRSQGYYVDVTSRGANKGSVVTFLAARYDIASEEIATIGDMHNDVSMFARSGFSIAMGNAVDEVKRAARAVTRSNSDEGFAFAIETFVLTP